jgi:hypothetical protein
MPNHEEHCQHSFARYGVRGDDIHSWIDEPSQVSGLNHRRFRHDLNSIKIAKKVFASKYDADTIENICLDHFKADLFQEPYIKTEIPESPKTKDEIDREQEELYRQSMERNEHYFKEQPIKPYKQIKLKSHLGKYFLYLTTGSIIVYFIWIIILILSQVH